MTDQDIHNFFEDHLDTLHSIITKNGYINDRLPEEYENLTTQSLIEYLTDKYASYNLEIQGYDDKQRHLLSGVFKHPSENKLLMVFFCGAASPDFKMINTQILKLIDGYKDYNFDCIIVTEQPHNSRNTIFKNSKFNLKFYTDDIFFDISDNIFVPKVLKKYKPDDKMFSKIDTKKFPKIILDDPLCSFYLCSLGDILELERDVDVDGISTTEITYRTVAPIPFIKKNSKK